MPFGLQQLPFRRNDGHSSDNESPTKRLRIAQGRSPPHDSSPRLAVSTLQLNSPRLLATHTAGNPATHTFGNPATYTSGTAASEPQYDAVVNLPRRRWSETEDRILRLAIQKEGTARWARVAAMLPGRTGKQCRERWHNHLGITKEAWAPEEDRRVIELHQKLGNRWADIAKYLDGRTDNAVKNRWNSALRHMQLPHGSGRDDGGWRDFPRGTEASVHGIEATPTMRQEH